MNPAATRFAFAGLTVVASLVTFPACGQEESEAPAPQGVRQVFTAMPVGPSSDPAGRDIVAAQKMALSERGGRAGAFAVKLVVRSTALADGAPDPELAVRAAREAARSDTSLAFIGAFTSGETAAAAPILNRAAIAQVTPTSTASALTAVVPGTDRPVEEIAPSGLRTLVRIPPSDRVQARALVAYMEEEAVRSMVIASDDGVYGAGLARDVARAAAAGGIRVLGRVPIREGKASAAATRAAALRPQAVFVAANTSPDSVAFLTRFARSDPEARIFLPDGLSEEPTLGKLGSAQPRSYVTNFVLPIRYYGPRGVRFVQRFRTRYGREPSLFALYGYESMALVLDAIGSVPDDTGLAITGERRFVTRRIEATTDRAGAIGSYSVTATGDTTTDIYGAYRVEDGRLTRGRGVTVRVTR